MVNIKDITAREILDSRANPTVECEVKLTNGVTATASVPSGASTGINEAHEKRDKDFTRYNGKGVLSAVKNINEIIRPALLGINAYDLDEADSIMITLDGMYNKSNLGANAILSVSEALARAGAYSLGVPLYRYLGGALVRKLPTPMLNILNGGAHADNNIDIQEFMIIPVGASSFTEAVRISAEIYTVLKQILKSEHLETTLGDEGGFAPMLSSDEDAIKMILRAVGEAGYKAESDIMLGLDVASSEWYEGGEYFLPKRKKKYRCAELVDYFASLTEKYPILSLEDAVGEEDNEGWRLLTERLGREKLLVGDDLFVTNAERVLDGIENGIANAVLIKPNQVGTVTETADAVSSAAFGGYKTVMSHRSADTEDSFIADLAVALSCDYIKTGAPARAERTAKYNRLMKIESEIFSPIYRNIN